MSHCHQTLYSSQCVFKDKRLYDHVFCHSDTCYGQQLLQLKNNGCTCTLSIKTKIYGLFWIQYGNIYGSNWLFKRYWELGISWKVWRIQLKTSNENVTSIYVNIITSECMAKAWTVYMSTKWVFNVYYYMWSH